MTASRRAQLAGITAQLATSGLQLPRKLRALHLGDYCPGDAWIVTDTPAGPQGQLVGDFAAYHRAKLQYRADLLAWVEAHGIVGNTGKPWLGQGAAWTADGRRWPQPPAGIGHPGYSKDCDRCA
jgi:hypothetical protein